MKNFPFKAINPDTGKEQEFWYSRSIAAAIFVYAKNQNDEWCILANRRGPGCPDYVGYWVCPCGYLDYNETVKEAAARECKEETGVVVPTDKIEFRSYNDDPSENRQNVTFRFAAYLDEIVETSNKDNEEAETTDIRWIPIYDIGQYDWAFGHEHLIIENL